jgi:hypothetical protein
VISEQRSVIGHQSAVRGLSTDSVSNERGNRLSFTDARWLITDRRRLVTAT